MNDDFTEIAAYYDELYVKPEEYKNESGKIMGLISTYKLSDGKDLLDIACGTGGHIQYWREHYNVTGLDINQAMLAHAIRKFPDIEFHVGDMIDFSINRKFDALVCLYGSIGFVRTLENLNKALVTFSTHLKQGGILCVTPWSTQEEFKLKIVVDAIKHTDIRIARMENVKRKAPGLIEVDFHHLIGRNGQVTYHTQSMDIGLFSRQQYTYAISQAKLTLLEHYQWSDVPMGVFVARKP